MTDKPGLKQDNGENSQNTHIEHMEHKIIIDKSWCIGNGILVNREVKKNGVTDIIFIDPNFWLLLDVPRQWV